tara:strand:+ start:55 stop:555 length:501 start_codon:yes stop_codon:yes gene_type:complete
MAHETALFAGGCFWGMQDLIRKQTGIVQSRVGYTGGHTPHPKYNEVCIGDTGHAEAIEVIFDTEKTTYRKVLEFFFQMHNPTTINRQGNDIGTQYRSAIFYINDEQKQIAEQLIKEIDKAAFLDAPVVTEVTKATEFHKAEGYHQDYLENNKGGYTCHFIRDQWAL